MPIFNLTNANFVNGSYRITAPGTYVVMENISFNPTGTRPDRPLTGFWFTCISIETDNVTIDLNKHTIEASKAYVDTNLSNVFSVIELGNTPYPENANNTGFGQGGIFSYQGDTFFKAPHNVIIKNGTIGRSSHWGIHGNNNNNVKLHNLCIKNFQVGGVVINAPYNLKMKNINVSGLIDPIKVTGMVTASFILTGALNRLIALNVPGASQQLTNLQNYIANNPSQFAPQQYQDGTYFGISMSSGNSIGSALDNPSFPVTPDMCNEIIFSSKGRIIKNVSMKNVTIKNLVNKSIETVVINSNQPNATTGSTFIPIALSRVFGVLRWNDAFDNLGNFAPNDFLKSMVFVSRIIILTTPGLSTQFPPNIFAIYNSILTENETDFFANVQPEFGRNFNVFSNKGIFGIKLDCANENIKLDCIRTKNINTIGDIGITLDQIPGHEHYPNLSQTRYIGNDSWGVEFASASNITLSNSKIHKTKSLNGDAFGIELATSCDNIVLKNNHICGVFGNHKSTTESVVNPSSEAYGISVADTEGINKIICCDIRNIHSPGNIIPIEIENAPNTIINNVTYNYDVKKCECKCKCKH